MDLKNCYYCGNTVHPGQGFVKEKAIFCSLKCQQQVSWAAIRQQRRFDELGGCLGTIGNVIGRIVGFVLVWAVILFLGVKACSSSDSPADTAPEPESELPMDETYNEEVETPVEVEPADVAAPAVENSEPVAPAPPVPEPASEAALDTTNLLELLDTNQQ